MLLGIDLGTGSVKAALLETDGSIVRQSSARYKVATPQANWAESNLADWWVAVEKAVRETVTDHSVNYSAKVQAIGLSGQMHGLVLCTADGEALRPAILWADTRSSPELAAYRSLSKEQRQTLANPLTTGMAGPSLLWLKRHETATYHAADWALQPKDWLRLRLCGEAASEPSDASATLLYDLFADNWAFEIIAALGLRKELLPRLIPSGAVAGYLSAEAAKELGLPAGLPVAAGAADTAAAMLGSGLLKPGVMQLTIGSGAQIVVAKNNALADPKLITHLYRAAAPRRYYAMAALQNAGVALEWQRKILGLTWPEVYQEAWAVPAGCEGLSFLPYLTGERTPHLNPQARGAWVGLGLVHQRGHLARAALEGVAFSIREALAALEQAGNQATELRLAGGGTLEPGWRQLLADVLERPLLISSIADASARGAALLAGIALGIYQDAFETLSLAPKTQAVIEPEPNPALKEAWLRFRSLYPRLN